MERSRVGRAWRESTRQAGAPLWPRMTRQASAVSLASQGRSVIRPGMALSAVSCSIGWWVGPSSPTPMESWVKMKVTGSSISDASRVGGRM